MNRTDWFWAAAAVAVHILLIWGVVVQNGSYASLWGVHDAVYYTAHLEDPLLQGDLGWMDHPTYRAMRLGYVALALPLRWLGVVPALVLINLAAIAAGTVAVRRIAALNGASTAIASAVWILNPGALVSTALLLPDTIAWAGILISLLASHRRRWATASALAVIAVLTKGASIAALGLAGVVQAWNCRRWTPLIPSTLAVASYLSLLGLLTMLLGPSIHASFFEAIPFSGWTALFEIWIPGRRVSMVVGMFAIASALLVLVVWSKKRTSMFLAAAAGQAILLVFLDAIVIAPMPNSMRIAGLFWPILAATRTDGGIRPGIGEVAHAV